jgi:hypothetical protein
LDTSKLPTLDDIAAERDRRILATAHHESPEWIAAIRRRMEKGDPGIGVKAPVFALIAYPVAETLQEQRPTFAT